MGPWALRTAAWLGVVGISIIPLVYADDESDQQAKEALWLTEHAELKHKVETWGVGDVDLKNVTIEQVLSFLRRCTRAIDPDHEGINFVAKGQSFDGRRFDLNLQNATVADVLSHLKLTRYTIGDSTVTVEGQGDEEAWSRTFHVRDNALAINPSMLIDKDKQLYDVKSLFEAKGLKFPPGTSAIYDLPSKSLKVVTVDPEDLIRIDELLVYGFNHTTPYHDP